MLPIRALGRIFFNVRYLDRLFWAWVKSRDYAARYRHLGEPIHLVGVEFSRATRNVTAFAVAPG